jgi:single-strand DNA-binding protein
MRLAECDDPARMVDNRTRPTSTSSRANNEVFLRGVLAALPVVRELPSGDELLSFRLTVRRPTTDRRPVDSIECCAMAARVRRTVAGAEPGSELEVAGSLQRRFWRTPGGPASRYEVMVTSARVTARPRSDASRGRTRASA